MCQLTVVNLGNKQLNEIADYLLSFAPSKIHNDGYGVMQNGRFQKTEKPPMNIYNLGSWIEQTVTSNSPIYSHIRQASHGISVCEANSHPFESDNFLLMHNGTLTKGGQKRTYEQNKESDSKLFLDELEKNYAEKKDFAEAFNNTMSKWWGKFAFLIYCKKEKQNYIIRGQTAQLYKVDLYDNEEDKNIIGFMVNTDNDNLKVVSLMLRNLSQILYKKDLAFSAPVLLEMNAIFVQDGALVSKITDTRENEEKDFEPKKENTSILKRAQSVWNGMNGEGYFPNNKLVDDKSPLFKIANYMKRNYFQTRDIALIYKLYMGKSIIQASEKELELFHSEVLKKLTPKGGISTIRFLQNNLKSWATIPLLLYTKYGLEYPWVVNPQQKIIQAVKQYNKETEKAIREGLM